MHLATDHPVPETTAADLPEEAKPALSPWVGWLRRNALRWMIVGALVWAGFAWGVVPGLIRSAYAGHGPAFIERAMGSKADWPVEHYLAKWSGAAASLLSLWVMAVVVPLLTTSRTFERKYVGLATPGTLGAIRAWIALVMLYMASSSQIWKAPELIAAGQKHVSMGLMDVFYRLGFDQVVRSPGLAMAWHYATMAALVCVMLGLFTRMSIILAIVLYVAEIGVIRSFYFFSHIGLVPWYCLVVLAFTRCGDGFSLDRMIRIWRQLPTPDPDVATRYYAWARWMVWFSVAITYVLAGLSKLGNSGWRWWEGTNLMALIYRNALNASRGDMNGFLTSTWVPHWAYTFMGIVSLVIEIGAVALLFSAIARLVLPIILAAMHYGIILVMAIPFTDLILIQAIFYDWRKIRQWVGEPVRRRHAPWILLYDSYCPLCRRTVGLLDGIDLFDRVEFQSFRTTDFDAFNALHRVNTDKKWADEEMLLVRDGKVYGGFDAYRQMSAMMPLLWPIVPLMWLPGVSHIGRAIYKWVAARRLSWFTCTDACQFLPDVRPNTPPEPKYRRYTAFAIACGIVPVLITLLWIRRTEVYPLSCFQMFSTHDDMYTDKSTVTFHQIYLRRPDGTMERAMLNNLGYSGKNYFAQVSAAFKFEPDKQYVTKWLGDLGKKWNAAHVDDPRRQIAAFELQEREWDFLKRSVPPAEAPVTKTIPIPVQ
jgi:predicted DCC family thiol-disulfide oxidoreductase YuxK